MVGPFGGPALAALLDAGAEVVAVAVPAPPGAPPVAPAFALPARPQQFVLGPQRGLSLLELAAARGLPALALRRMGDPAVPVALAALRPDLLVVACWPWRLPPAVLAVPRLGALNLHPSPLPELRGPEPLFWAFHEGRAQTAVTLHWMDAGLDTGPIALQRALDLPLGASWREAEVGAAELGAELLGEGFALLATGRLPRRAQGDGGSYRPAPGEADFTLDPGWPAERAFRFMRGTANWGRPYEVVADGFTLRLGAALSFEPAGELGAPYKVARGVARVQFSPGLLAATLG
jgi:methionyl-tRNA formyltransferase